MWKLSVEWWLLSHLALRKWRSRGSKLEAPQKASLWKKEVWEAPDLERGELWLCLYISKAIHNLQFNNSNDNNNNKNPNQANMAPWHYCLVNSDTGQSGKVLLQQHQTIPPRQEGMVVLLSQRYLHLSKSSYQFLLLMNVPPGNYFEMDICSLFDGVPFAKVYKTFYYSATQQGGG